MSKKGLNILIIDDNQDLIYTVKESLLDVDKSLNIEGCTSGKDCLKYIKKKLPDIFIVDIMMPEMNGWELSFKLKGDPNANNIPIIFLTAIEDSNCKRLGLTLGVDYLMKPFNAEELYSVIIKNCHKIN
jgi:two-component system sensor histidine kinase/response regulator